MSLDFNNLKIKKHIIEAEFGLEKEGLRVDNNGNLAHTKHPFSDKDKNIDRDFCENQVELISDVFDNVDDLLDQLDRLHDYINAEISKNGELYWPFSNPPYVKGEDDIPVASFEGELKEKEIYRNYLASKYGKMKMLFSGIHFNFSFSKDFIRAAFSQSDFESLTEFKNKLYIELSGKVIRYNWLLVYLMAASPLMDSSFIKYSGLSDNAGYVYSTVRCSEVGYWNDFIPVLNYSDLESYIESINTYINIGQLKSVSELYYPVRLKPTGKNSLESLKEKGVNHIELRLLDVNPFSKVGIFKEDIKFIHLFILYLLSIPDVEFDEKSQITAIKNIKTAALYDDRTNFIELDRGGKLPIIEAARYMLGEIERFAKKHVPEYLDMVNYQREKTELEGKRYASAVREIFGEHYVADGLSIARKYSRESEVGVDV